MAVWSSLTDAPVQGSNRSAGRDEVWIMAEADGVYQVDITGASNATYGATIVQHPRGTAVPTAPLGGSDATKMVPSHPAIPLLSSPYRLDTPPTVSTQVRLFMPLLVHNLIAIVVSGPAGWR